MIPNFISKADLEIAVLNKLYLAAHTDKGELEIEEISSLFNPAMANTRIKLDIDALRDNEQIDWSQARGGFTCWSITNKGMLAIEEDLSNSSSFLRSYAENGDQFLIKRQAPASDRIVSFDHNQPEVKEIARSLASVREDVRGANDPSIDEVERDRVLHALTAAEEIWSSASIRVIQLKVGVLMALEGAGKLLRATAKAASVDLIVEAFKAFARNYLKVDLDT